MPLAGIVGESRGMPVWDAMWPSLPPKGFALAGSFPVARIAWVLRPGWNSAAATFRHNPCTLQLAVR